MPENHICAVCGTGHDLAEGTCPGPAAAAGPEAARSIPSPSPSAVSPADALSPGTTLGGRYEVIEYVGRGAGALVYKALDRQRDNAPVAVKVLSQALAADPLGIAQLKREANLAMKLAHKNLIRLHNFEEGNPPFLVMEFADRGTLAGALAARLDGRTTAPAGWTGSGLSPAEIAPLLTELADGLDYAHREGVIHRDIKPANILLASARNGMTPKTADFGIAAEIKLLASRVSQEHALGTVAYMSPEHLRGGRIDGRADIYSLAATVYHCLAGIQPFSRGDVRLQIESCDPPGIPGLSAPQMAVISKAMSKKPDDRYATCREFADSFAAADTASGGQQPPRRVPESPASIPEGLMKPAIEWDPDSLVLLLADDVERLVPSELIAEGDVLEVTLVAASQDLSKFLSGIPKGGKLGIAFRDSAVYGTVASMRRRIEKAKETFHIEIIPLTQDHSGIGSEMTFNGITPDQQAEARARRILLGEPPLMEVPDHRVDIVRASTEDFLRGRGTPIVIVGSPFPAISQDIDPSGPGFIQACRLAAVLRLKLSNVVEKIDRLELRLNGGDLDVDFAGVRPKKYENHTPSKIAVKGTCKLKL